MPKKTELTIFVLGDNSTRAKSSDIKKFANAVDAAHKGETGVRIFTSYPVKILTIKV